jgi:hypothetical protein
MMGNKQSKSTQPPQGTDALFTTYQRKSLRTRDIQKHHRPRTKCEAIARRGMTFKERAEQHDRKQRLEGKRV